MIFSLVVLYVIIRHFFLASYYRFRDAGIVAGFAFAPIPIYIAAVFVEEMLNITDSYAGSIFVISVAIVACICGFKKKRQEAEQAGTCDAEEAV